MNSFSDIVGRQQTSPADSDKTSPFVLQKMESSRATGNNLPLSPRTVEKGKSGIADSLVQGLIERLPKPDSEWSFDDRAKWLRTAASIFDLVYSAGDDEQREIKVAIVEQDLPIDQQPGKLARKGVRVWPHTAMTSKRSFVRTSS